MNIGVDAREIQFGVVTGIGRSLANFIKFFCECERVHRLVLFSERPIPINFSGPVHCVVVHSVGTLAWDQVSLLKSLRSNCIKLFYSPYYKVPLAAAMPVVNQVLDLMYLLFPEYRSDLSLAAKIYYAVFGRLYCLKSMNIITDSAHAKGDIIQKWKVRPSKVTIVPLGVSNRYRPITNVDTLENVRRRLKLPDKYILYLGNFKPHKNVETLIRAFKKISSSIPDYYLVLAGPLDERGNLIRKLVEMEGIGRRVRFTGTIKEDDCPEAIYSLATLFVFPSLYEGFGLPPLEAMACGVPVVASNLTAIPEVVGDAGLMVDAKDAGALGDSVLRMLGDGDLRRDFIQRGLRRSRMFSEEKTAGALYQHLRRLYEDIL
jgi:glycosyltransferase involved in cell wall biosynthesis